MGKASFDDDDSDGTVTRTVSTDPDSGVFRKGEHKTNFAYEAHTVCDRHIWADYLDTVEAQRKSALGKETYAMRQHTIGPVFGAAKEKHAMRYTRHRGPARVSG